MSDLAPPRQEIPHEEIMTQNDLAEASGIEASKIRTWHARRRIPGVIRRTGPALFDRSVALPAVLALNDQ